MGNKSLRLTPARAIVACLALAALPMASFAFVSVGVSINIAPPALPVYIQPPCPAVGYIWTPGYWAYDDDDYYWVPGTWVLAPSPGLLWTPGYWGWGGGGYYWHAGYWGPHVGFYGGINYGYGYGGVGFEGGYWRGDEFYYNRSVSNLGDVHVTNVYNRTVVNNISVNRVSYNGGRGGLSARPSARELSAEHDRRVEFTSMQREHEHLAATNQDLRASVNGGKPRIAATERPAVFSGRGIVAARAAGAPYRGGAARSAGDQSGLARADVRAADRSGAGRAGTSVAGRAGTSAPAGAGTHVPGSAGTGAFGRGENGGTGRGEQARVAIRNDRPPGAGSAAIGGNGNSDAGGGRAAAGGLNSTTGRGVEFHGGGSARSDAGRTPESRSDRPPGAGGAVMRGGVSGIGGSSRGGFEGGGAVPQPHYDRPPGAGGATRSSGSGGNAGGIGGGARALPQAHYDRPSGAGGASAYSEPSGARYSDGARGPQPHMNQISPTRGEYNAPQPMRPSGLVQPMPRQFNGGGGGQPAPHLEAAPRPQMAPRMESRPNGGEPRGQSPPQPQSRGGREQQNRGGR